MGNSTSSAVARTDSTAASVAKLKDTVTNSVLQKIEGAKNAGLVIPQNYNCANNITLALIELSEPKQGRSASILESCTPASVATALYKMCVLGLSLVKKQCDFIPYGNQVVCQPEYTGRIAMAKRLGHAGTPVAQVIYEGDVFEYTIDPQTGNKVVTKHEQKLGNIDKDKIIGAWCSVPYADDPQRAPFVDIMTMAEIRQSWMQGAAKGNSPAHRNFPAEMAKKTIISRACKLFIAASDDADIASAVEDDVDEQTGEVRTVAAEDAFSEASTLKPVFEESAAHMAAQDARKGSEPAAAAEESDDDDMPEGVFDLGK